MSTAILYLIATPLGNLEDITLRAIKSFKDIKHFFAEDTRELVKLFNHYEISGGNKKFHSYASHNLKKATDIALSILEEGESIALVTDRGMPCISDPGSQLVKAALERGIKIVPIPGPSSVTTVMAASGVSDKGFCFLGFLPDKNRKKILEGLRQFDLPVCFFESPKRVRKTVKELSEWFTDSNLFIGREMTKMYEEFKWLKLNNFDEEALMEKGEYALVLNFKPQEEVPVEAWHQEIELRLMSEKDWSKSMSVKFGVASKEVYNALQKEKLIVKKSSQLTD